MKILLSTAVCLGLSLYLVCFTLDWQKASDAYEAKFKPDLRMQEADKPFYLEDDAYYWISYAEQMVSEGTWRIRHTDIDNAPYGREVHWSQSFSWLLSGAGKIRSLITGDTWVHSVPRAAMWVNPFLFAIFLSGLFCLLEKRLGFLPALIAVAWLISHGDVWWGFHPYRPDHQSLHLIFSLLSVVLLALGGLGWTREQPLSQKKTFSWLNPLEPPSEKLARRYFIASGIAGGMGLWIGATVEIVSLALVILSGLAFASLFPRHLDKKKDRLLQPRLWRLWGISGALTSLAFYGLEYFPNHISMRLEVNHPIYALVWVAMSECLVLMFTARSEGRSMSSIEWKKIALWGGLTLILPAVLYFGGSAVHALRDPQLVRLYNFVLELKSYSESTNNPLILDFFENHLLLPLFVPIAVAILCFSRLNDFERFALLMGLTVTAGCMFLAFLQQRWFCFYAEFNIWLMVLTFVLASTILKKDLWSLISPIIAFVLMVLPLFLLGHEYGKLLELKRGSTLIQQVAQPILIKRFSLELSQLPREQDAVILADPGLAPPLYYFGRLHSVFSFYWENTEGVHAAVQFLDATDPEISKKIARERRISHVAIPFRCVISSAIHYIHTGESKPLEKENLASQIMNNSSRLPSWLQQSVETIGVEQKEWNFDNAFIKNSISVWEVDKVNAE